MTTFYTSCDSPVGTLLLTSDGTSLTGVFMDGGSTADCGKDGGRQTEDGRRQAEADPSVARRPSSVVSIPQSAIRNPQWGVPLDCRRDDDAVPFVEAKRQLAAYFRGDLEEFDLPLAPAGTEFQRRVWQELARIPYGATISYGELARRVGNPKAARAVGLANGRNPVPIVVPCHRVIGSDGRLSGYGGGLGRKEALLALERAVKEGAARTPARREGRPADAAEAPA
jgi:methylated-DNA-[protein]-cysteine S-methyltransferase